MENKNFTQRVGEFLEKNGSTISVVSGLVLLEGAIIGAVWATKKSQLTVKDTDTKKEKIKKTWKFWLPVAAGAIGGAVLVGTGQSKNEKTKAALGAACAYAQTSLGEYKEKVREIVGKQKEEEIAAAADKEVVDRHPVAEEDIVHAGYGTTKCFDRYSGRYFYSDIEWLRKCQNDLNEILETDMYVSLNEMYSMVGLSNVELGDELGFNIDDGRVKFTFGSILDQNGKPCLTWRYSVKPKYKCECEW